MKRKRMKKKKINAEQQNTEMQNKEPDNKEKEKSVGKPLILYFLIVCLLIAIVGFSLSVICYGVVHAGREEERLFIGSTTELSVRDVAIVPGTAVYEGVITAKAKDRLLAALELYQMGLVNYIVVSGDVEETTSMTQYLMASGVPSGDIGSDEHGVDTYETLARTKEKLGALTYYFCTQELYVERAQYLMDKLEMDGVVVCVDTMYYNEAGKSAFREYFAATKAVLDPVLHGGKPKKSVQDRDFIEVSQFEENSHVIHADEVEAPEDYRVVDVNPKDNYDVNKAVEYATTYALENNPEYPAFEENCTNFVSQCLVAGGIAMEGTGESKEDVRYVIGGDKQEWYSYSTKEVGQDGYPCYSTTTNFINTNAFIEYFTKQQGYELSVYQNNRQGKLDCLREIASGDVLIFFGEDGEVVHIGLVTGIGEWNAYYCGNTNDRKDYGVFRMNEEEYTQFGIMHMSGKLPD